MMMPVNTVPVKPRTRSSDGIQNRLEDLNLQPKPKVVSAVAASGIDDEMAAADFLRLQDAIRKDSGRSARGLSGNSVSLTRHDSMGDSENGSNGEELGSEDEVPETLWKKFCKILRENRIGFFLLIVAPIALSLGKTYSPSEFGHLDWRATVVVECTIVAMILMINDQPSDLVLLAVNVVLLNMRIISIAESLKGLSSPSVLSIGILFVVARAMEETGVVESLLINMLGNPKQVPMAVLRLGLPVAILSAFMNNTPIVAMMIPTVQLWSERTGISASKLLMPLSFAAMLGGMCTLLGTSTNLILQDLAASGVDPNDDDEGDDDDLLTYNITMFSMSAVGVPLMVIGIVFMAAFSFLLPSHEAQRWSPHGSIEVYVETASGKTVKLVDVLQGDTITVEALEKLSNDVKQPSDQSSSPNKQVTFQTPNENNQGNETVQTTTMVPSKMPRLQPLMSVNDFNSKEMEMISSVRHSHSSENKTNKTKNQMLTNQTSFDGSCGGGGGGGGESASEDSYSLNSSSEEAKFDADKVNNETQLSSTPPTADELPLWASSRDIQPPNDNEPEKSFEKMFISGVILVSMVSLAAITPLNMSIFTLSLSASCLLVLFGCITVKQAFEAIKGRVLLAIFATYGLGAALGETGVAALFARALIYVGNFVGPVGLLTMIFLCVSSLSCVVSNQATVILLWPVVSVIDIHGLHIGQFAVILMMGASTSFATPIGYQTNLMVYEPGGYEFKDFARLGIPLTLIIAPFASLLTYYLI